MGWMEKNGLWGDEPQDIVSDAIEKRLGKDWYQAAEITPRNKKLQVAAILLKDKALQQKINKTYMDKRGKPVTVSEYKNLIRIGLLLKKER